MDKLFWNDNYSVGIRSVDNQHQKLFTIINDFYNGLNKKKNVDAILSILEELKKYTIYHFSNEESLMSEYNYPGYKRHKQEHDYFTNEISMFEEKVREGKLLLSIAVTSFLEKWIKNHILNTDMAYSEFLLSRGVQ